MLHHEKKAFFKFFIVYFLSVAIFILAAGFFYFEQMKGHFLKSEELSIIEYARHIKMDESLENFGEEYSTKLIHLHNQHIDISNFTVTKDTFMKLVPIKGPQNYIKIFKSKSIYDKLLLNLKKKIIIIQVALLILFAFLSYTLAKNALKPLRKSIETLDKFSKDLIHDLNTPVTAINLNMKILDKNTHFKDNTALLRIKKSVHTISELHENLTILLQEETFQMQNLNVFEVVDEVMQIEKQIYPSINFYITPSSLDFKLNKNAFKQILQNIISNACKYNTQNGFIKIYAKENALLIEDSGKGIKDPSKIFERSYSTKESSGLGLDIVKRLANSMSLNIEVTSTQNGSIFILKMD